ncbi:hypothetical protein D9757_010075 [Collybiopsis confluens]|uniref:Uncharacterized protein n=1 Tax=Collybiopsis confluens TaxID=2823264 RepID=A0A8H5GZT5_9AGAR|nr:hypothetical protein D9757_010075 [Collybiopsis confluens]
MEMTLSYVVILSVLNFPFESPPKTLYRTVYTFLATLVLLLGISGAIVARSLVLRRRHRRMIEEAIRNRHYKRANRGEKVKGDKGDERAEEILCCPLSDNQEAAAEGDNVKEPLSKSKGTAGEDGGARITFSFYKSKRGKREGRTNG